ncbi:MAG: NYN domain-containing protein [Bifidobacteriaceae bacterium]|jgi:uncharacterized LabA/DUF88 family protein|nr:NYN domain-containing protein [Bifidobacteriaceae bacterium]
MRSQCCLYVDAGYLLAAAATRLTGTSLRVGIKVKYEYLIAELIKQAEALAGMPVLRINWYDGAKNALPDKDQERIGALPRVKVRLGRIGPTGEQKGVDLLIGLDMVAQARNGAVDAAFLVSGDDDLTEAVAEAQVHGVQVKVLAVPNSAGEPHAVSQHLLRASDGIELIRPETLDQAVERAVSGPTPKTVPRPGPWLAASAAGPVPHPAKPGPAHGAGTAGAAGAALPHRRSGATLAYQSQTGGKSTIASEYALEDQAITKQIDAVVSAVIGSFLASATEDEKDDVINARPSIRSDLDRALLLDLAHRLDDPDMSDRIRWELRDHFWDALAAATK